MNKNVLIVEDQFIEANYLRSMLTKAGYTVCGIARSVKAAQEIMEQETPGLVLLDIFLSGKLTGIDLARQLKEEGIAFIYLSANSNEDILAAAKATQPDGFLVKPFREKDLLITLEIAEYRHEHGMEKNFRQELLLKKQFAAIAAGPGGKDEKLLETARSIQPYFPFEYLTFSIKTPDGLIFDEPGFLRLGFDEYQMIGSKELMIITNRKLHEILALQSATIPETEAAWYDDKSFRKAFANPSIKKLIADSFEMISHLVLPLVLSNGNSILIHLFSRRPDAYNDNHLLLFNRLEKILRTGFEHILAIDPIKKAAGSFEKSKADTVTRNDKRMVFEGIIGNSHLLLNVFDQISQVANSDTSVLILGESGTGKERIAGCIHELSPRKGKAFIKINCAALPATLIESELFGHEKGAFTGALEKRVGKFEQADQGTIFLDEIGEMPVEMQVKLLRVLQEKEIERIGGKGPIKINVRIIAATNRNLEKEVAEGRFRLDLYYRVNVFPIMLPSLSDRKEDIPALIDHFISYYNRKAGKRITGISEKVSEHLMAYHWPGNIRELEHLVERSVLLAKGNLIESVLLPPTQKRDANATVADSRIKTIFENERDHIIAVLKKCNGRIRGAGGAAELLNVPPTTLGSKMKKLGIKRAYSE